MKKRYCLKKKPNTHTNIITTRTTAVVTVAIVTAVAATGIIIAAVVVAVAATGIIIAAEGTDTRMIQKCSRIKT